ncbi:MAG: deoxyribodipyrimidine photo-lyase, partial [Rhodospirillales bacterium]|nr:deoxyribodipyrimidine photo-lyase [Rhodospirillales bacterium]
MTTIVWFRQDLRLADNPALHDAAARGAVVPVYILDDGSGGHGVRDLGAASKWWLHHSLRALERSLGGLVFLRGDPMACLRGLVKQTGADAVHWNRCYEPGAMARDTAIKDELGANGLAVKSFNAALLFEPWQIETGSRSPFKVYSPFWRAALTKTVEPPRSAPDVTLADLAGLGEDLDDWALVPKHPDWAAGWTDLWRPGEAGAMARLKAFLETGLDGYGALRDRPDRPNVSRLSPHLHFGEISPRQVWAAARYHEAEHPALTKDVAKFLAELGWREFAYHLLHHFPTLPEKNWRP